MTGFVPENFPERSGSREQIVWMRAVEDRIKAMESARYREGLNSTNDNSTIGETLRVLGEQVSDIAEAQERTAAITTFLLSQSTFTSRGTVITWTGSMAGSVVWEAFNGTYDCELTVTTGASGIILVSPSSRLVNVGTTATPILAVEVVGITGPDFPDGAGNIYFGANGGVVTSRTVQYSLAPNTAYTVRTRRGRQGTGSGLECNWGYQSLGVTRLA